jgi:autotransporter-associated beta strand protein
MQNPRLYICLLLSVIIPRLAVGDLVGPYTADANTIFLSHFDESAGSSGFASAGTKGGNFYSVNNGTQANDATPPVITTIAGGTGFSTNYTLNGAARSISFGNCLTFPTTTGYLVGYDGNKNGAYNGDNGTTRSADQIPMTSFNMGNGGQTPWTMECLFQPTSSSPGGQFLCTDSIGGVGYRGFQWGIGGGQVSFVAIYTTSSGGTITASGNIPTTGNDALVVGAWYHTAVTYDGTNITLYWTRMDPNNGTAHAVGTLAASLGTYYGSQLGPLAVGNTVRKPTFAPINGNIDEVRVSSVCRTASQMQFNAPWPQPVQNPLSQNIDYNMPVTFNAVFSAGVTPIYYQWRFNSNNIAGATNTTYTITNVAAGNAGYYDCVATNLPGYRTNSLAAQLTVGAVNFLSHRWSFTNDTSDSVGGATGTNFGNAVVSGGKLVLDGTANTYMQLPSNLINGTIASAVTFDFWASLGANSNAACVYEFGYTNVPWTGKVAGGNYLGFQPHGFNGEMQSVISGAGYDSEQQTYGSYPLDNVTVHVTCVYDSPDHSMSIYTNGVLVAVNANMTTPISYLNDTFSYVGRSLYAFDPTYGAVPAYLNGSIDEIRIYNGALSPASILQSDVQGPDQPLTDGPATYVVQPASVSVPLGLTATLTSLATGYLPITYQWYRNGVLLPAATNATYSFVPTLNDNNTTYYCTAANTIGITSYPTNSTTATLTVYVPPTLAWLGTAAGGQDNSWNTTSLDWSAGSGAQAFAQNDGVLFDDRSSGGIVDLEQAITPYSVTINAASSYTLTSSGDQGALVGYAPLTILNSGTLTIDLTNNMAGPLTISGGMVQVGNNDAFGSLGSGVVTNNATISFARSDAALNVGNAIHGSGSVSFNGTGTVTISGTSDYAGGTLINQGIVKLQSNGGLGAPSGSASVAGGAQLYVTANVNVPQPLTLSGSGPDGSGGLRKGGAGTATLTGPVALASDLTIGLDSGATLVLSNTLTGSGAVTVAGINGNLKLTTANNGFSGGLTIVSGAVYAYNNNALGTGSILVNNDGAGPTYTSQILLGNGVNVGNPITVQFGSSPYTGILGVDSGTGGPGSSTDTNSATFSGPLTFVPGQTQRGGQFAGPASGTNWLFITGYVDDSFDNNLSMRVGRVCFSGGGNYTTISVGQGTIAIGANNGLCPSAMVLATVGADGVFDLNGFTQTLTGLSAGSTQALVTNSAAQPGALIFNESAASTYNGAIAGNLSLTLNGPAGLICTGPTTYTGNTIVNGGTLELTQAVFAATSTVTIASGAVLQLDAATTNIVAGLVLNGISQPLGVYSSSTSSPYLAGSGSLLVAAPVAVSTNAYLTSLTLNPAGMAGLTTSFASNILSYVATNAYNMTPTATAVDADPGATNVMIYNSQTNALMSGVASTAPILNLTLGVTNVLKVQVTAADGVTVNTYTVNIMEQPNLSTKPVLNYNLNGGKLNMNWGADRLGYRLLMQTNNLAKGISDNLDDWTTVPGSTAVTTTNIPTQNPAEFYRLVYP